MDKKSILEVIGKQDSATVDVPEWGVTVNLKGFSVAEWMEHINSGDENTRAYRVLAHAIVGDNGKPLFTPEEIAGLPAKQSGVLLRLFQQVRDMNGDGEEVKKA